MSRSSLSAADERLFRAFVEERQKEGQTPEASPVEGIAIRTLRRYVVDGVVPTRIEGHTRLAMARYLTTRGVEGFDGLVAHAGADQGNGLVDLDRLGLARVQAVQDLIKLLEGDRETFRSLARARENLSKAALIEAEKAPDRSGGIPPFPLDPGAHNPSE